MSKLTAAALLMAGLIPGSAYSQAPPNPTQQNVATSQNDTPVFRLTIVGRSVPAVNFRPRSGDTELDFEGTPLMPGGTGTARIKGQKGYIEVDARFDKLQPPGRFGREYLTYVLWAITPEGRATNLGEVQYDDNDARIQVTTELQAFALVLTAEPYFAVSQPSDVVVMQNVIRPEKFASLRDGTEGRIETLEAKYELLKRGSYLMNTDPALLKVKALEPGAPLDLGQARNAIELARLAGADRFAADTFAKAQGLLAEAEAAREQRKSGNTVQQPARQAAQTAEDARLIAIQRQEEEFQARQRALAAAREADANAQRLAADNARLAAERGRADADAARLAAERERAAADAARAAAERERLDADAARAAADQARLSAEAQAQQARDAATQAEREKAELRANLLRQLNVILETRETARGLIVNLSDVLFDFNKADLKPGAREKLAKISGIVLGHPGLKLSVEGHTDNVGTDDYNLRLSERRAASVQSYLVGQGISQGIVTMAGFGEAQPVATNGTAEGRQQNRRVELVVSGAPIGVN